MAGSNSPFSSSSSISSLLRSATSAQEKIRTYEDSVAAYQWDNSAKTYEDFVTYNDYLNTRKTSATDPTESLTYQKKIDSARSGYISNEIQRQSIDVVYGTGTNTTKYNKLVDLYDQAASAGQYDLAQSLYLQAANLSVTIQNERTASAEAAKTLAKATATANVKAQNGLASELEDRLKSFNDNFIHAGQKTANKLLGQFVQDNKQLFADLGITLKDGVQPNYFDIVDGMSRAITEAYGLAAQYAAPYADDGGQSYIDKAKAYMEKIPTAYGKMSSTQLQQIKNSNVDKFTYNTSPDYQKQLKGELGTQAPQIGYSFDATQGVQPIISNDVWVQRDTKAKSQLEKLGLKVANGDGTSFQVSAGDKSPDWLKKILPSNAVATVVSNNQTLGANGLQFEADATDGQGKAVYTITYDQNGKKAVYESSNLGDKVVSADAGYDFTYAPNSSSQLTSSGKKSGMSANTASNFALGASLFNPATLPLGIIGIYSKLFSQSAGASPLQQAGYTGPLFKVDNTANQQSISLPTLNKLPEITQLPTIQPLQATKTTVQPAVTPQKTTTPQKTATNINQASSSSNIKISNTTPNWSIHF